MSNPEDSFNTIDPEIFMSLLASIPLSVVVKDREGRCIYANDSYCQQVGLSREEFVGMTDFDIYPPGLAEKHRRDDNRIIESGHAEKVEEFGQDGEYVGERVWKGMRAPLKDHGTQHVIGTIGVFWEVSSKTDDGIALAEARNLLRNLIDNIPDLLAVKDRKSRCLMANVAVARFVGASTPEKLVGKRLVDFSSPEQAGICENGDENVISTGRPIIDKEEVLTDYSGCERRLRAMKVPWKNIKGEIGGIISLSHDVTRERETEQEVQRLERQLHHARKMETMGSVAAGMAHDLNNMLAVINGYAELIQLKTPTDSPHYDQLGKVLTAGRNAAGLLGKLLAFSRDQAAQAKVINVNSELQAILSRFRRGDGGRLKLCLDLGEDLWPVRMDPLQLEQIIVHLATNARDAMSGTGELTVSTENVAGEGVILEKYPKLAGDEWVALAVKDTGGGIQPEVMERLFEPFFTTKPPGQGAGLGLATVFGIVKQNKGQIFADNREDGSGAEFFVFLRKSDQPEQPEGSGCPEEKGSYGGGETILVIEDDEKQRKQIKTILADFGYTVYTAANGAEALLAIELKGNLFNVVLTEVIMAGISGTMLADEIHRRNPDCRMLFMSGYGGEIITRYGIADVEDGFIQKPFSAVELARKIRSILEP